MDQCRSFLVPVIMDEWQIFFNVLVFFCWWGYCKHNWLLLALQGRWRRIKNVACWWKLAAYLLLISFSNRIGSALYNPYTRVVRFPYALQYLGCHQAAHVEFFVKCSHLETFQIFIVSFRYILLTIFSEFGQLNGNLKPANSKFAH